MPADDTADAHHDESPADSPSELEGLERAARAEAQVTGVEPTGQSLHEIAQRIVDAAIQAEYETGDHEETEEEARQNVMWRLVRMVAGFVIIGIGIGGLVLPGPGWLLIILGLSLLPFAWAERTITAIRRKVPGVPEDGRIPTSTWIVMGSLVVIFAVISLAFGNQISDWVSGLWGDPDKLIT